MSTFLMFFHKIYKNVDKFKAYLCGLQGFLACFYYIGGYNKTRQKKKYAKKNVILVYQQLNKASTPYKIRNY